MSKRNRKKKAKELAEAIEKMANMIECDPYYVGLVLLAMAMKCEGIEPFEPPKDEC